jgi:alpha-glucosidase
VPTTWDETKVLDAKVNEFITIARRKGNDWYIGTITNHDPRDIRVPLSFLNEGNYTATIYSDAADTDTNPDHLNKQEKKVSNKDVIQLHIADGGGEVMQIKMNR